MNKQKPIFLLAGGRGVRNQDILRSVFEEIGKDEPVIAYVGAANGDDRHFFTFMGAEIKGASGCKLNQVLLASKRVDLGKAKALLEAADAVFISGGDVETGMEVIQSKGLFDFFHDLFNNGKLFFGASAGSIMLADQWVRWNDPDDDSTAELFTCLGLAPVICDTHAEDDNWVELSSALQLKGNGALGYGIPSGACLKISLDGKIEALGKPVIVYTNSNGKMIQKADLMPRNY